MQIEANKSFNNMTPLRKPCRQLRLSEPEFRALKKLAQWHDKTIDEEIFNAVELWGKACGTQTDLSFWSETEPRFKCLHDSVALSHCSESEPDLIEAAIRRHIHDFDANPENETDVWSLNETLIVTLQLDGWIAGKLWSAKRISGKSLSNFVEGAVTDFTRYLEKRGVAGKAWDTSRNRISTDTKQRRKTGLDTFHINLSKKIIGELCMILQFNRSEIERAVILAINWKLLRSYPTP